MRDKGKNGHCSFDDNRRNRDNFGAEIVKFALINPEDMILRIELILAARHVERNSRLGFALDGLDECLFFVTSANWEDNQWTIRAETEIAANRQWEYVAAVDHLEKSFPKEKLEILTPEP